MAITFIETKGGDPKRGERVFRALPEARGHTAPTIKYDTTSEWVLQSEIGDGATSVMVSNAGSEAVAVAIHGPTDEDFSKYHVVLPGNARMIVVSRYDRVWAKTA
jgi:hypothetical protein